MKLTLLKKLDLNSWAIETNAILVEGSGENRSRNGCVRSYMLHRAEKAKKSKWFNDTQRAKLNYFAEMGDVIGFAKTVCEAIGELTPALNMQKILQVEAELKAIA